jgi:TetR/AcrR family transcriptional repressor of nem operon
LAFTYNVQRVVDRIKVSLSQTKSPIQHLYILTSFYCSYRIFTIENGGCPVINVGVDANHDNMRLFKKVREIIKRLQRGIEKMILAGIEAGEIKTTVDAD